MSDSVKSEELVDQAEHLDTDNAEHPTTLGKVPYTSPFPVLSSSLTVQLDPLRGTHEHYASPEERTLVRKLDIRIMPIACLLYLFAYLDRTNLGSYPSASSSRSPHTFPRQCPSPGSP